MKKIALYTIVAMMSIALAPSCTVSQLADENNTSDNTSTQIIKAYTPAQTKVGFSEGETGISLKWETDDSFSVYELNGKWVADFVLESLDNSTFKATSNSKELVDGIEYVALYPARPNNEDTYAEYMLNDFTLSQSATAESLENLNSACNMSSNFTWNGDAAANFVHNKAIMTVQFDDIPVGQMPSSVRISDGNNKNYQLSLSEMPKSTGEDMVYSVNLMIDPADAVVRNLTFTIIHTDGVNVYNVANGTTGSDQKEPKAYAAGYRYVAPVKNLNEQQSKSYWIAIKTADDLEDYLNDPTKNAVLAANINMSGKKVIPSKYLAKIFDGNGYAISNLNILSATGSAGMFAGINGTGVVKNLILNNPTIKLISNDYVGAIAGKLMSGATISNCTVINGEISAKNSAGGIAGNSAGGIITGCNFDGNVTSANSNAAGILAVAAINSCPSSVISNCRSNATVIAGTTAGGIVANGTSSIIYNCEFSGSVKASTTVVGGILGQGSIDAVVYGCVNKGAVVGTSKVGGIAGTFISGGYIVGCYNLGIIGEATITTGSTAGIIGEAKGTVNITSCYNYSMFGKEPNNGNIGQITGFIKAAGAVVNLSECYYVNLGTGNSAMGTECDNIATLNSNVESMNSAINASSYSTYNFVKGITPEIDTPFLVK